MVSRKRISFLEGLLLLVLCGFAIAFLFETTKLGPTAALFPRLVAEASLVVFVIGLALRRPDSTPKKRPHTTALALQAGYAAMVVLVGFPIATLMYLLACPRLMGYQRWKILFPYAILLTGAVFLAFAYILNVRLPRGLLWS